MNGKEALNHICENCERAGAKIKTLCPYRSISGDYCEAYEQIKADLDELNKYKKLEKQIGCPLEVRCELYSNKTIYTADGDGFLITDLFYDLFIAEAEYDFRTKEFKYSDHKKTWWLKADRSE